MATRRATPEREIKRFIQDFLSLRKGWSVFPIATTGIFDPSRHVFRRAVGRIGTPDFICCYLGRFVAIEAKSPKGRPSDEQLSIGQEIKMCGGQWWIIRTPEEVKKEVSDFEASLCSQACG
jgi:hypothetical protein